MEGMDLAQQVWDGTELFLKAITSVSLETGYLWTC